MQQSSAEALRSLGIAREAGEVIREISRAVTEINERNLLIATASEQQALVARSADQTTVTSSELTKLAVGLSKVVARLQA
ncbi:hypothetical protein K9857_27615 [Pseudomonas sp. REP124]|uniref:hypothetical protein n=1 Tax=Pseudomonas sp. REP124 TaxID=2875731 RepID=UPI001CCA6B3D|nr:hypothetical protein [Pseudomonas sp. REP124]MBZ9785322.1 hypothetical protein [Pseudomonas sp. REP124]